MSILLHHQRAFTLVELSLVLLILGLLTRSLLTPLAGARTLLNQRVTADQLESVRESLIGHVVANGALPCPLPSSSLDPLVPQVGQTALSECSVAVGGLPASTLGLAGATDEHGQLLDVWNRPYRYAVSLDSNAEKGDVDLPDWTTPGEATRVGMRELEAAITVCSQPHAGKCPQRSVRANNVVFVVLSLGPDDSPAGSQAENLDDDQEYLLQDESIDQATLYDDQLIWSTAADIMYWMLRSGWLP